MTKFKDALKPELKQELKPAGKIKISRIFVNSKNHQISITLPRKKLKCMPGRIEVTYWGENEIKRNSKIVA